MRWLRSVRRDTWQPARPLAADSTIIVSPLLVMAVTRGWDYLTGHENSGSLDLVEAAAPLWFWGSAFILGAIILLAGRLLRAHMTVWAGHFWLGTWHGVLMIGIAIPALGNPWGDGIRGGTAQLIACSLHLLLAMRTGPRPLTPERAKPVEEIGAPE